MRQLKFRVWDKVKDKMFKPYAISFDTKGSTPFAVLVHGRSWEPIGKFEVLQWTGLVDSNGTDVYEGDFLKIGSIIYTAVWSEKIASFELQEIEGSSRCDIGEVILGKIIGHKFQKIS